jgi:hypothetical protein
LWRARSWRKLLNLIDHLPQNSYYYQALMDDDEHAKAVAAWQSENEKPGEEKKHHPGWQTWSPEVEHLASIEDELRQLRSTLIAVNGAKPPQMEPVTRPKSKVAEQKKLADYRRKLKVHDSLVAKMLPHKAE